jgi:hypothetical protein
MVGSGMAGGRRGEVAWRGGDGGVGGELKRKKTTKRRCEKDVYLC